jgi:hypothetical protein
MQNSKLQRKDGQVLDIFPHEFWYIAPAKMTYSSNDGFVRPLEFGFTLHNAVNGEGLVIGLDELLVGIEPSTSKGGVAGEAEDLLERVRKDQYPNRPSRLRSYYLNYRKDVAEFRLNMFRGERMLVRCYLVLNGGRYHYADISLYEQLEGRPDDLVLAQKYWETSFNPESEDEHFRLEVLADSALFFPDWDTFPTLSEEALIKWSEDNSSSSFD